MTTDLWPEFAVAEKPAGARAVLKEAGTELKRKTKGVVELRVTPFQDDDEDTPIGFECHLVVPAIRFEFLLFWVRTDLTGTRSKLITSDSKSKDLFTDDDLRKVLADYFHDDRTQRIVQNLISMASE